MSGKPCSKSSLSVQPGVASRLREARVGIGAASLLPLLGWGLAAAFLLTAFGGGLTIFLRTLRGEE